MPAFPVNHPAAAPPRAAAARIAVHRRRETSRSGWTHFLIAAAAAPAQQAAHINAMIQAIRSSPFCQWGHPGGGIPLRDGVSR